MATPGRLLGLVRESALSLASVNYLVLDEADRMLDMGTQRVFALLSSLKVFCAYSSCLLRHPGFEPDIRAIIAMLPSFPNRQTLLFSATWPEAIQRLGNEFVTNPIRITVGRKSQNANGASGESKAENGGASEQNDSGSDDQSGPMANASVTQIVEVIEDFAKEKRLEELLQKYHHSQQRKNRVIVFVLYKKEAERVENNLRRRGWGVVGIHGDKTQADRTKAFDSFRTAQTPILVATDVAARGLDIPDVSHVINYSFPLTVEDYVHRIGRTGRAGKTGVAHTFFTKFDKGLTGELVNVLNRTKAVVPAELLKFGTAVKKKTHALYGEHFRDISADGPPKARTHIKFD